MKIYALCACLAVAWLAFPASSANCQEAPLTEAECREFGKRFQAAITGGDVEEMVKVFRYDAFAEKCLLDLKLSPDFRKGLLEGMKTAQNSGITKQISTVVKNGGSYVFLRARMKGSTPRIVMRLLTPEGSLNYHLLPVERFPDGEIATQDAYVVLSGETISQSSRRILMGIAAERDRGLLQRLLGMDKAYTENLPKLLQISTAVQQGQHKEAYELYKQLPVELQEHKSTLIVGITCCLKVDESEYLAMMNKFREKNPNDPSLHLLSLDYFTLNKQYDKVQESINKLDELIGGDPYLWVMRSNVYVLTEDWQEAKAAAEKAVQQEPTLVGGYWVRISVALREKNHADTLTWLKKIVTQGNMQLNLAAMESAPDYAHFVKSPEFKQFQEWYPANVK